MAQSKKSSTSTTKKKSLEKTKNVLPKAEEKENIKSVKKVNENNQKRNIIIAFIIGLLLGLLIMMLFIPERIAKLTNGEEVILEIGDKNITADDLYTDMKNRYTVDILLDKVDNIILSEKYPEDNDMKTEVNKVVDYYISMYETYYGYSEDQFLEANGFKTKEEFENAVSLDYRRNKYLDEYAKSLITETEIKNYYNSSVYGDIEAKYIIVSGTDDTAKSLAQRIITKLNNGESFEQIVEHYGDRITSEDLGYVNFNNDLDSTIINTLTSLKDNTYTKTPVEGTNDFKIIIRGESKEKSTLDDIKDQIIDILVKNKKTDDSTLLYKALINLRKENKVEIKDTDLAKKYNEYIKKYN